MAEVENNSDDDALKRTRNIAKVEEVPDDLQTPLPSNIASSQPLGKLLGRRVPHGRLRPKSSKSYLHTHRIAGRYHKTACVTTKSVTLRHQEPIGPRSINSKPLGLPGPDLQDVYIFYVK